MDDLDRRSKEIAERLQEIRKEQEDLQKRSEAIREEYRIKREKRENDFALFSIFIMATPVLILGAIVVIGWLQSIS